MREENKRVPVQRLLAREQTILILENKRWDYYVSSRLFLYERAQSSDQQAKPVTGHVLFCGTPHKRKGKEMPFQGGIL